MKPRDHGGGLDAALAEYGGQRAAWLDLSTGVNPVPYPLPEFDAQDWNELPDAAAQARVTDAARAFWNVPDDALILPAPGASALIARIPALWPAASVQITAPTYNEHAAAFGALGWDVTQSPARTRVVVSPNNPTGAVWEGHERPEHLVIDESFCDTTPHSSRIALSAEKGVIILKSFGKFWGLAGMRLGFAIARGDTVARLRDRIGPWAVAGPALKTGALALADKAWADATRRRLKTDARRLDDLLTSAGAEVIGGTDLFRLAAFDDAAALRARLAREHRILTRIFPYSGTWIRFGLPGSPEGWARLESALADMP